MRVLMLSDFYPPFAGGVEQHARNLARGLVARGHNVAVVTQIGGDLPAFEVDDGVRVYRISGSLQRIPGLFADPNRRWAPMVPDPEITAKLRGIAVEEKPDIVHAHSWIHHSYWPIKPLVRAPLVVSLHNYGLACPRTDLLYYGRTLCSGPGAAKCTGCGLDHFGPVRALPILATFGASNRLSPRVVDMWLPETQSVVDGNGLARRGLPYRIIPNFVPDDVGTEPPRSQKLEGLPSGGYILFVGALRPFKGVGVLLEAYQGLADPPPLVLLGGAFHDTPKEFPAGVTVLRDWPHGDVMEAFRRSLFTVVPSLWPEPCPAVAIEALTTDRPVIASRIGGLPDIVKDGETGLLVPHGDVLALRAAMARLLGDAELRARLGAAGDRAADAFRASTVVHKVEAIYREILDRT